MAPPTDIALTTHALEIGELRLVYDVFTPNGQADAPVLLLIMGISMQRIFWDERFCRQLACSGYRVVRYDTRDVGESTHFERQPSIDAPGTAIRKRLLGQPINARYQLSDLASDAAALIAAVGAESAHIVSVSMGGMVAQHLALEHPHRVRSLTLIMTTTGAKRFLPKVSAIRALLGRKEAEESEAVAARVRSFAVIGSPAYRMNQERLTELLTQAYRRDPSTIGFFHHFGAMMASGDRTAKVARITAPTLVIHGSADPLIPLAAGRHLAKSIPGAAFLPVAGMGHDFGEGLWPIMVPAITAHVSNSR